MSCISPVSVCGCVCLFFVVVVVFVLFCFYGQQEALVWFGLVWFLRQRKSSSFTGNQSTNCSSVSPKTQHASVDTKAFWNTLGNFCFLFVLHQAAPLSALSLVTGLLMHLWWESWPIEGQASATWRSSLFPEYLCSQHGMDWEFTHGFDLYPVLSCRVIQVLMVTKPTNLTQSSSVCCGFT